MSSTSDPATLALAYRWYMSCRSCHKTCRTMATQLKWHPKRLIDVGVEGNTTWRLLNTSSEQPRSPVYMTLSYRWRKSPSLKLTSQSLAEFSQGLPIKDLPETFRHAIAVLRRFSVRYLWVDCLCILQDSELDWEIEASSMQIVYANSACNISATASNDPGDGLFRNRKRSELQPRILQAALLESTDNLYHIYDAHYWHHQILDMPLHRRGWVLQERLLAPRTLHFAQQQIFWECQFQEKCEVFPFGLPKVYQRMEGFPSHLPMEKSLNNLRSLLVRLQGLSSEEQLLSKEVFWMWCRILSAYSRCDLTFSGDKFVALSGLAHAFSDVIQQQYIAGCWRPFLVESLDWRVYFPRSGPTSKTRAPSWSWASVDGEAAFNTMSKDSCLLVTLVEAQATHSNTDPFGQMLDPGFITLRGHLTAARLYRRGDSLSQPWHLLMNDCKFLVQAYEDRANALPEDGKQVFCLALKLYPTVDSNDDTRHGLVLMGLLLERIELTIGHFRRVGHFIMTAEEGLEMLGVDMGHVRACSAVEDAKTHSVVRIY